MTLFKTGANSEEGVGEDAQQHLPGSSIPFGICYRIREANEISELFNHRTRCRWSVLLSLVEVPLIPRKDWPFVLVVN